MPSIGLSEIIVIVVIALLVIKPADIPTIARKVGRFLGLLREYKNTFVDEMDSLMKLDLEDGKPEESTKKETKTDKS